MYNKNTYITYTAHIRLLPKWRQDTKNGKRTTAVSEKKSQNDDRMAKENNKYTHSHTHARVTHGDITMNRNYVSASCKYIIKHTRIHGAGHSTPYRTAIVLAICLPSRNANTHASNSWTHLSSCLNMHTQTE